MDERKGLYEQVVLHISSNHVARLYYENIGYKDVAEIFEGASISELMKCARLSEENGLQNIHFHLSNFLDNKKFNNKR